jgi:hypothetical protein
VRAVGQANQNQFKNMMVNDHLQAMMSTLAPDQMVKKLIGGAPQIAALGVAVLFPWSDLVLNALTQVIAGKSLAQVQSEVIAGIGPTIEDVCVYLYGNATLQAAFRQKLIDQLHAAQKFDEVILISHSLGTVIAFDVLNAWTEPTPKIPVWFTMGCPLAKALRLDSGRQPQLNCPNVDRWYNVYNTNDLVANPLSPIFALLDSPSSPNRRNSVYDIFVQAKVPNNIDPIVAHDYYANDNALRVVADAIAAF